MKLGPGGLIRSKTGCATCRTRKVKCDEAKPVCLRCQKGGWKCEAISKRSGRASRPATTVPRLSPALPPLPHFDDLRQREFFTFFVICTSNHSSVYLGANFWARRVLQMSLSEPSIRYALCSLSALARMTAMKSLTNPSLTTTELRRYALLQYHNAVKCTRSLLAEISDGSQEKLMTGLVACALFVCFENFMGNIRVSHMHLQNGLQIILREAKEKRPHAIPKDVVQVFQRLDLQAITFRNASAPYRDDLHTETIDLLMKSSTSYDSIEDCLDIFLRLCRILFREATATYSRSGAHPFTSADVTAANNFLEQWNLEISKYLSSSATTSKEQVQAPLALLKMYQIVMTAIMKTGIQGIETLHDAYLHHYTQIVLLGEELARTSTSCTDFFCFDVGVIFPLFWVAIKCRDSQTRRRAAKVLAVMHHQEGMWKSATAAKIAEFVIAIEEEGLPKNASMEDVPEFNRVHLVTTVADAEIEMIRLYCLMRSDEGWFSKEGRIPFVNGFEYT